MEITNRAQVPNPVKTRAAKLLDEIIAQVAKEENISIQKAECVIYSVYALIAEDIRSGTLKGSHVLHQGKFKVKSYNVDKFYQLKDELEEASKHLNKPKDGSNA
jgi:UDP-N-acetylglucosamine enolpyruvyl transferase